MYSLDAGAILEILITPKPLAGIELIELTRLPPFYHLYYFSYLLKRLYLCIPMKRNLINTFIAALVIASAGLIVSCGSKVQTRHKPTATVSIPPQQYLLKAIAGDSITINCLLQSGSNPESFEPGIALLRSVSNSDALLLAGNLGFESAIAERVTAGNGDIAVYDTSRGIDFIYGTHDHCDHHDGDDHHDHGGADPHTWTSIRNARIIAANMLDALTEIDPDNAGYYRANFDRLDSRLDSLDRATTQRLAASDDKSFIVWHPSLSYFARDYGLEQISVGQEGKETSVKAMQQRIAHALEHNVKVFFFQKEFDSRQAETLNSQIGARMVIINPMNPDWEHEIKIITDALDPQ